MEREAKLFLCTSYIPDQLIPGRQNLAMSMLWPLVSLRYYKMLSSADLEKALCSSVVAFMKKLNYI